MIDWQRVKELQRETGAELFDEIVELFIAEVEEAISPLRRGLRGELEETLHFLKGSALNLGFSEFARQCSDGERMVREGHVFDVDIAALIATYDRSRKKFLEFAQTAPA